MKVLIIDDSVDLCNAISKNLNINGHEISMAHDGQTGLRMALSNEYDIILLDVMMPQMNGYTMLKKFRAEGRNTPVIMITAKDAICDRIEGLEAGADDYIQKPFNMDELTARMRALARRCSISNYESDTIRYADITFTLSSKKLIKNGLQITLTQSECNIIKYLIKNSSVVVPEEKITEECSLTENSGGNIGDIIDSIKRKLKFICSDIQIIFIRGIGYKLCG